MSHPDHSEEYSFWIPDQRAEVDFEGARSLLWLILAEADHPLGFPEIIQDARRRQRPGGGSVAADQLRRAADQEILVGHLTRLAFRNRARLTPAGLAELEQTNPHYRRKVGVVAKTLVAAAESAVEPDPAGTETRIGLDNTLTGGISVSWSNFELGLMRLSGTDLMESERPHLPEQHQQFGVLHLVERRLEFGDLGRNHVEETLVFDYPGRDPEAGARRWKGQSRPDMQTEVHRDRVALGVLRQLAAELVG